MNEKRFSRSQSITFLQLVNPQALLSSALVSDDPMETLNNAEQFMVINKDYRTSAVLYTVALQSLEACSSPGLVADILCKRAECLLRLVSTFLSVQRN